MGFGALLIFMFLLIVLSVILIIIANRKMKKVPPDFYALFIFGIIFFLLGISMKLYLLSIFGLICLIIGLLNKEKWKKNRTVFYNVLKQNKNLKDY